MNQRHLSMVILLGLCLGISRMSRAAETGKPEKPAAVHGQEKIASLGQGKITVHGQGKIIAEPDLARLTIEVSEDGSSVEKADRYVRRKMEAVLKALKAQGIPDKDIQTQSYQVIPRTALKDGATVRVGFTASNQVAVALRDLKKTGTVLSAVLDSGANEIRGPFFELDHSQELERKALGLAFQDARAKALLLAETAGTALGAAVNIEEGAAFQLGPRPVMSLQAAAISAKSAEEPIKSGETTVQAAVTATFALNQK